MSLLQFLLQVAVISAPIFGLGCVIGFSRGEDAGYKQGYHEGEFDAKNIPGRRSRLGMS